MQFDMNQAWREASAMVKTNSQLLGALAGVFFFLPSLAMVIFAPFPETIEQANRDQAVALFTAYYAEAMPWLLGATIFQSIGMLTLLALLTDRRPTVGEALRTGAIGFFSYMAAQLLVGVVFGVVALLVIGIAYAGGLAALAVILIPVLLVGVFYAMVKTSLVAPVVVIEGLRNPISALQRSWALTRRNSLRLFLFYFLVIIAFAAISIAISMVIGIVVGLVIGDAKMLQLANGAVSGLVGSVFAVYAAAILAAVHRQLAGPSAETIGRTFE